MGCTSLGTKPADVTGIWNASIDTPQGPIPLIFDFNSEGSALSGTLSNQFIQPTAISNGMIDGNTLTFTINMQIPNIPPMTINYTATVEGNEMSMTSTFEGTPPPGAEAETVFTATRAE